MPAGKGAEAPLLFFSGPEEMAECTQGCGRVERP